jgi:hypothetical protein
MILLVGGTVHEQEAKVAPDRIIGIYDPKKNSAYLYHPSLGSRTLGPETSTLAVGHFLLGVTGGPRARSRYLLPKAGGSSAKLAKDVNAEKEDDDQGRADVGVSLEVTEPGKLVATNRLKRWAAVKSSQETRYLLPLGDLIELGFVETMKKTDVSSFFQVRPADTAHFSYQGAVRVEAFGSVARVLPLLMNGSSLVSQTLRESVAQAVEADGDFYLNLNAVEYVALTADAVGELVGIAVPHECLELIAQPTLTAFEAVGVTLLTKEDSELHAKLGEEIGDQVFSSFSECVIEAAAEAGCAAGSAGAGSLFCVAAGSLLSTTLDILKAGVWTVDNAVVGTADVLGHSAYGERCFGSGLCSSDLISGAERAAVGLFVALDPEPLVEDLVNAFLPAVVAARHANVHVFFVNGKTGDRWPRELGGCEDLPGWLAKVGRPRNWDIGAARRDLVRALGQNLPDRAMFDRRGKVWTEIDVSGPGCVAHAEWPNHWQMLEVGLVLRAQGMDAVRVRYTGPDNLHHAGRGVERRVQQGMAELFGVVLDWGVSLE